MKILVVGLGLIGGSMCKAMKKYTYHTVTGCDRNHDIEMAAMRDVAIDEIYGGRYDTFRTIHTHSHYRVLEYQMYNGELKLKNRYRFKAQDAHVGTVFLYGDILRAAISVNGKESYKILTMVPIDDDSQFYIYGAKIWTIKKAINIHGLSAFL